MSDEETTPAEPTPDTTEERVDDELGPTDDDEKSAEELRRVDDPVVGGDSEPAESEGGET